MEKVIKKGTNRIDSTCYAISATKEISTQNQNWQNILKGKPKVLLPQKEWDHVVEIKVGENPTNTIACTQQDNIERIVEVLWKEGVVIERNLETESVKISATQLTMSSSLIEEKTQELNTCLEGHI